MKIDIIEANSVFKAKKWFSDTNNNTLNVTDNIFCYGNNQFFENLRFWAHVMIDTF